MERISQRRWSRTEKKNTGKPWRKFPAMMGFPLGAYQDCFGTRQPLELVNPALVKPPLLIFSSSHPLISLLPSFLPLSGLQFFFFLLLSLRFFFPLTNTLFSLRLISFVLRLPPTRSFFNPRKALLHALAQPCTNCASIPTPSNTTWSACLLV